METKTQLLFMLSALGGLNGLLLAFYFFVVRPRRLRNILLSLTFVMISLRTLKSAIIYYNSSPPDLVFQIGLSACFLIGPFSFFYASAVRGNLDRHWVNWKLHLGSLILAVFLFGIARPFSKHEEVWWNLHPHIDFVWLIYSLGGLVVLWPNAQGLVKSFREKGQKLTYEEHWPVFVVIGCFIIWLAYFTSPHTSYAFAAASFTVLFFLGFLAFLYLRAAETEHAKYQGKKIDARLSEQISRSLLRIMEKEEAYRDPNFTLPKMSKKVGVSASVLSQYLNDNLDRSFYQYVNQYRVEAVKSCLIQGDMKMDDIIEVCGFNSQSTLYAAFKSITGTTPARFKKTLQ